MPEIPLELLRSVRERLPLPAVWEPEKTHLETWTTGRQVWKISWWGAGPGSPVHLWTDVALDNGEILDLVLFAEGGAPGPLSAEEATAASGLHAVPETPCTEEEALVAAHGVLAMVHPDKAGQVDLSRTTTFPSEYRFFFRRLVHGIPYDPDGIEVTVDKATGTVQRVLLLDWSNTDFPRPENVVGREQANQFFLEQFPLQLMYLLPVKMTIQSIGLDGNDELDIQWNPDLLPGHRQAYLVYAPAYCSLGSSQPFWQLDAGSGQLIDTLGQPVDYTIVKQNILHPTKEAPASVRQAQRELDQEEARRRAQPILDFLGGTYELVKARKDQWSPGEFVWELQLVAEAGEVHLRLDGCTGEICFLNYCLNEETGEGASSPSLSRMAATARQLLELCLPTRAGRMVPAEYALPEDYRKLWYSFRPLHREKWSQAFTFIETVNGLPVANNLATVILSGNTGKVQSFNYNRAPADTAFPDPAAAMPPEDAARRYLEACGLELAYVPDGWGKPGERPAARLVYRLKPLPLAPSFLEMPGIPFLDACTGRIIDREGRSLT